MFPDLRCRLDIELIQSNHPVEPPSPTHPGDGVQYLLARQPLWHCGNVFQGFPWPARIAQLIHCKQRRPHPHLRNLLKEVLAFFIAGYAEKPFDSVGHFRLRLPFSCVRFRLPPAIHSGLLYRPVWSRGEIVLP